MPEISKMTDFANFAQRHPLLCVCAHDCVIFDDQNGTNEIHRFPACGLEFRAKNSTQRFIGLLPWNNVPIFSAPSHNGIKVIRVERIPLPADSELHALVGDHFPFNDCDDPTTMHPSLIVSSFTANQIPDWYIGCVYTPDTGPNSVVRGDDGSIRGVTRLIWANAPSSC